MAGARTARDKRSRSWNAPPSARAFKARVKRGLWGRCEKLDFSQTIEFKRNLSAGDIS